MYRFFALLSFAAVMAIPASITAATLEIGAPAPDFRLPGVDGKDHSLSEYKDAKILVVVFTCNHCPTAQAYEERIKKLTADFKDRSVAIAAISPNDPEALRLDELGYTDVTDSLEGMKYRAKDHKFNFPYLYDGADQKVSRAYGPAATPHVFIFDAARKLCFTGRIDNNEHAERATQHDTRAAIEALLAGRPVPVAKTKTVGCSTKWAEKRDSAQKSLAAWAKEEVSLATIDEAAIKALVKNPGKKLLLVNVWATWCIPCVAELPEFVTMNRMYRHRGLELVTLSADAPESREQALGVLKKNQVAATNYLFSGNDKYKLMDAVDEKSDGSVPFTMLIAPGGKVLYRKSGACEPLEVKRAIVDYLGRTYP